MSNTAHNQSVADKNAARIGLLELRGAKASNIGGFFFARRGSPSMGDRAGEPKGSLVTLSQQSNPARSSSPIGLGAVDFQSTKRSTQ